jgi:hypothetical protein
MAEAATKPWAGTASGSPLLSVSAAGEDRRGDPRQEVLLRAEANGVVLWTTNVSSGGMQLRCPALVFGLLQPGVESGELSILLWAAADVSIPMRCAVVYLAHYGYDYLLGVRFAGVAEDDYARYRRHCLGESGADVEADAPAT